jgi:hypothetical protein
VPIEQGCSDPAASVVTHDKTGFSPRFYLDAALTVNQFHVGSLLISSDIGFLGD